MESVVCEKLINEEHSFAVVGLGYVGMSIAVVSAEKGLDIIDFDNNESKVELYKSSVNLTKEL